MKKIYVFGIISLFIISILAVGCGKMIGKATSTIMFPSGECKSYDDFNKFVPENYDIKKHPRLGSLEAVDGVLKVNAYNFGYDWMLGKQISTEKKTRQTFFIRIKSDRTASTFIGWFRTAETPYLLKKYINHPGYYPNMAYGIEIIPNSVIRVIEEGKQKAYVLPYNSRVKPNTWYEFTIVLKPEGGAEYYYYTDEGGHYMQIGCNANYLNCFSAAKLDKLRPGINSKGSARYIDYWSVSPTDCSGLPCQDSDSTPEYPTGKNYEVKGYIKLTSSIGTITNSDNCIDEQRLKEYSCTNSGTDINAETYTCSGTCKDGACLPVLSYFTTAVDDQAPVGDVMLATKIKETLNEKEYNIADALLFSQIDALDLDNRVTLAIYNNEALIIIGEHSSDEQFTFSVELREILDSMDIKNNILLSSKPPTSNLMDLFIIPTCMDSDGGINAYEKGKVEIPGFAYEDRCLGENVWEYYCENGEIKKAEIKCLCNDGVCYNSSVCTDSENPSWTPATYKNGVVNPSSDKVWYQDEYIKGTIDITYSNDAGFERKDTIIDQCIDNDNLVDFTCNGFGGTGFGDYIYCENGCQDGACIQEEPVCTDSDGGNEINIKGTTTLKESHTDYCDGPEIMEYWCGTRAIKDNEYFIVATPTKDVLLRYQSSDECISNITQPTLDIRDVATGEVMKRSININTRLATFMIEGKPFTFRILDCSKDDSDIELVDGSFIFQEKFDCPYNCQNGACIEETPTCEYHDEFNQVPTNQTYDIFDGVNLVQTTGYIVSINGNNRLKAIADYPFSNDYIVEKSSYNREDGLTYQISVNHSIGAYSIIGWFEKSLTGVGQITKIKHGFLLGHVYGLTGSIHIIEDNNIKRSDIRLYEPNRALRPNIWYDVKVVLKDQGAEYYIREQGRELVKIEDCYGCGLSNQSNLVPGILISNCRYKTPTPWEECQTPKDIYIDDWKTGMNNCVI